MNIIRTNVSVVACLLVAACGSSDRHSTPPSAIEQTAVVAYSVDMQGVNELTASATSVHTFLHYFALFLPLLEEQPDYQQGPPSFEPRLASSWDFSNDGLELTFEIRADAVWSDGMPITADDVRWTWQAHTSEELAWPAAEAKERIVDVEVVEAKLVKFHFSERYSTQLLDAITGVVLPKHRWSSLPFSEWHGNEKWFIDNLVVSGPFTLAEWQPQQRIVLTRNPRYFEAGLPRLDRVVLQITPDRASQLALLRSGQAQMAEWVRPADAESIDRNPDLELLSYTPRFYTFITWNLRRPLFTEPAVRRALTMAIDRQAIVDSLYYGRATVASSPLMSNIWAHNQNLEPWQYAPNAARELLAEAGWVDTDADGWLDRDGEVFRFEILTNAENEVRRDMAVMIQDQLGRVGIEVQVRTIEFSAMMGPLSNHDFDAAISALAIDTTLDLSYFFHSEAIEGGFNWGAYASDEMDDLITRIEAQTDHLAAKPLFDRLQEVLHADQPVTFLYEPKRLIGIDRSLINVAPNQISEFFDIHLWALSE